MAKTTKKKKNATQKRAVAREQGHLQKPSKEAGPCPVVGIGASAGGLDALNSFLDAVKEGSELTYVVITHLDPAHRSHMSEILAKHSALPVRNIEDGLAIDADTVYVLQPNTTATIEGRKFQVSRQGREPVHTPVDTFFRSLAEDCGENAACVILSGAGSDGTIGLRAIKEAGGLTLAQGGAEYDGMMRSALATGLVDFVLPVADIPAKLRDYFSQRPSEVDALRQDATDYLTQIATVLRARTGHDFSGYKDRTIVRRIQRRMQVLQLTDPAEFLERLRREPSQVDLLFQDLLIGVTNFFRDPRAWAAIEDQVIPKLFENKGPEDTIRVWVPGCATGEEAYSIAMLLRERAPKLRNAPKLQIFASDIDEQALEIARIGRYPQSIAQDIPLKRLERHFVREDGTYRIASDLREICLFSMHNLLRDAPFSKLDLISCRNLMIYLNTEVQGRVIPLFHYALRDNGYLFLGTSENVTRHARLFAPVDKVNRIFIRRPLTERRLPEFPLTASDPSRRRPQTPTRTPNGGGSLQATAERELLDRYAPAYVIIDAEGEMLHVSAKTGKYLEPPAGAPNSNIYNMSRRGLRLDLRAAVHRTIKTGQTTVQNNVTIGTNGGRQVIDLYVQPLKHQGLHDVTYLVVFQDVGGIKQAPDVTDAGTVADVENINLHQLEAELRATKERLQTTTEELESSNEELKSGNEELSSMNEELQSANEELETSKEELQSINEELQTVNAELNARVEELSHANSDIANLLESTQIATVFLDRDLNIKSFTPAAKDMFHLVESDTGRPLAHVRSRLRNETITHDAERVLRTLSTIERRVDGESGTNRYIMRILPYRTVDNVIAGVVVTFNDVTQIVQAEERIAELTRDQRNQIDGLESLLDIIPVGIFIVEETGGGDIKGNRRGAAMISETLGDWRGLRVISQPLRFANDRGEVEGDDHPLVRAAKTGLTTTRFEGKLLRRDDSTTEVIVTAAPLFNMDGHARGAIAAVVDISELRDAEAQREMLLHELQHRVKNILATVSSLAVRMSKSGDNFTQAFLSRLAAMGKLHELLANGGWDGTDLRALVMAAVGPQVGRLGDNLSVAGPAVRLKPNATSTLGMVFHELATNAAKYGGLSVSGGRVEVIWRLARNAGNHLIIVWNEAGGPPVPKNHGEGFGTGFLKRSVEFELGGEVDLQMPADGVRCTVTIPVEGNVESSASEDSNEQ